jgi:hypothetical protein
MVKASLGSGENDGYRCTAVTMPLLSACTK